MKTINKNGFTLIELLIVVTIIVILAAIGVPNFLEAQVRSKVARSFNDMAIITTSLESYRVDYGQYPIITSPLRYYEVEEELTYLKKFYVEDVNRAKIKSEDSKTTQSIKNIFSDVFLKYKKPAEAFDKKMLISEISNKLYENNFRYSPTSGDGFRALTTPISYVSSSILNDPFERNDLATKYNDPSIPTFYKYLNLLQINPDGMDIEQIGKNLSYILYSNGPDIELNPFPIPPIILYDPSNGTISSGELYYWHK